MEALRRPQETWWDSRLPARQLWTAFLAERIPGGARWAYVFGSVCLALVAVQCVTGAAIACFYVPAPNAALASIQFLSHSSPLGRVLLGIHHWSANILVGIVLVHAGQTFLFGAHKKPRELVWLTGAMLLLAVQAFHFSGYVLPWDQKGYWATQVATSMMGTVPKVGDLLRRLICGGDHLGALTLSHFYALHVVVLPAVLLGFVGLHLVCMRYAGPAGSCRPRPAGVQEETRFWPDQALKDAWAIVAVLTIIVVLAVAAYTPPASVADPTDSSVVPRPEWNFLFLYQLQHYFPGRWEWVGALAVPGALVAVLLTLPFLDRKPERRPRQRLGALAGALVFAGAVASLTVLAVVSDASTWGYLTRPAVRAGARLYAANQCASCHKVRGEGGDIGPDLSFVGQTRTQAWLQAYLRNPQQFKPESPMPALDRLSDGERAALAAYLRSLR